MVVVDDRTPWIELGTVPLDIAAVVGYVAHMDGPPGNLDAFQADIRAVVLQAPMHMRSRGPSAGAGGAANARQTGVLI